MKHKNKILPKVYDFLYFCQDQNKKVRKIFMNSTVLFNYSQSFRGRMSNKSTNRRAAQSKQAPAKIPTAPATIAPKQNTVLETKIKTIPAITAK